MIALRTSDLKSDFSEYLKKVFNGETIILTRPKKENIALISEERLRTLEKIEANAIYLAKLERGIKAIENGETTERELIEI